MNSEKKTQLEDLYDELFKYVKSDHIPRQRRIALIDGTRCPECGETECPEECPGIE
jgi:hypothetical protein